jgi:hypothetical protein
MIFAQMGMMQAIHRHHKRVFNPDRKDTLGSAEAEARYVMAASRTFFGLQLGHPFSNSPNFFGERLFGLDVDRDHPVDQFTYSIGD